MPVQRGLAKECQQHFQTTNLYEIFSIPRTATDAQVKKAYRQLALRYHPDRTDIDQKEEAKTKFQIIGKVYATLSDEEKRKIYDDTGAMDDDDLNMGVNDWYDYCKKMFRKVTKNDLVEFENKYKGSDEEKNDLKRIYVEVVGDMDQIFERHLLTCLEDEDRLRSMIDQMIEDNEVPPFDAYTKETKAKRNKRHRKLTKEAAEAEKLMKELNIGNDDASLERAIQLRQQQRASSSFYDQLLEKYGSKTNNGNKKRGSSSLNNNKSKKTSINNHGKRAAKTDDEDEDDEEEEEEEGEDIDTSETLTDDGDVRPKRKASSKKHGTTMKKTRRPATSNKRRKVSH
ncbi:unnamed protein product [Rotaria socialis]|uniref:J domain-containing protein n=1 Tax=Rotaria socialis TaxID=392032 RepID=A0A820TP04_9BILA|nr:unnamed protein product [Rotaria socialis]CAF4473443.1 unnamed protein product [Rotaria socialis]